METKEHAAARMRAYYATPKGQTYGKAIRATPERKAYIKAYGKVYYAKPKNKAKAKARAATPENKGKQKARAALITLEKMTQYRTNRKKLVPCVECGRKSTVSYSWACLSTKSYTCLSCSNTKVANKRCYPSLTGAELRRILKRSNKTKHYHRIAAMVQENQ